MSPLVFTPEPWRADQAMPDGPLMIVTPRGQLVAMVLRGVRMTPEEMEGNARLIACSPRMYTLMRGLVLSVNQIVRESESRPSPETQEIFDLIRSMGELLAEIEAGI